LRTASRRRSCELRKSYAPFTELCEVKGKCLRSRHAAPQIAEGEARGLQSLNEQRASDSLRSCEFRLCYCGRAFIYSKSYLAVHLSALFYSAREQGRSEA